MTEQPIPASPVEADLEFMKALQDKGPQKPPRSQWIEPPISHSAPSRPLPCSVVKSRARSSWLASIAAASLRRIPARTAAVSGDHADDVILFCLQAGDEGVALRLAVARPVLDIVRVALLASVDRPGRELRARVARRQEPIVRADAGVHDDAAAAANALRSVGVDSTGGAATGRSATSGARSAWVRAR